MRLFSLLLSKAVVSHRISINFEDRVRAWLFSISAEYCGWPPRPNAWLYPDIHDWDEDETGNHTIPAYISFYMNQQQHITLEDCSKLNRHLSQLLPIEGMGKWDLELHLEEGWIMAIRRHIVVTVKPTPNSSHSYWYSTLEFEEVENARYQASGNGQIRGEIGNSLRSVRPDIQEQA